MILFVVESPTKIKTLQRFLKNDFIFRATFGHIKDLPKAKLGIDLNTLKPTLYWLSSKRKVLAEIKRIGSQVREVYLATDPDREGEAIAYHLYEYLSKIKPELKFKRLDLIEITENGLKKALSNLRDINTNLYQSWLTRRVLDRLIGYLISPQLSKTFKKSLSAGRVQSIALRLIVEREKEIENFVPEKSYSLEVKFKKNSAEISAELYYKNKLYKTKDKKELTKFLKKLQEDSIILKKIEEKVEKKNPPLPLKTTTLIEISQKFLGYEPKQTMYYAQRLYENGYITYMRTDSVRVSEYAQKMAKEFIKLYFGEKFIGQKRNIRQGRFVQDAHECIRPTDIYIEDIPFSEPERKLYKLIRSYFIASQMAPAEYLVKTYIFIHKNLEKDYTLRSTYRKLVFEGFLKIFKEEKEKDKFVDLRIGEVFKISDWEFKEHITEPPSPYTPSTLIKKLESMGIGRPSTYATLLDILYKRKYVIKEKGYLKPTELGKEVCEFLEKRFPKFLDYKFTSKMEEDLEKVVENKKTYQEIVSFNYEILKNYLEGS